LSLLSAMELCICGKFELPYVDLRGISHMISVQTPNALHGELRPPHIPKDHYLYLRFSDTEDVKEKGAPEVEDMRTLEGWLGRQSDVVNLLVHCDAGMSRSPAVALLAVLRLTSLSPADAMDFVSSCASSKHIWPNLLVLKTGDQVFGYERAAFKVAAEWMQSRAAFGIS